MSRFIQLHLLTSYSAANLNRDDTGRPKVLTYGGAERLRVSSQSLKRAFRISDVFAQGLPDALGVRSKHFAMGLLEQLKARGLSDADAATKVEALFKHDKLGKAMTKDKDRGKTEQLVHLAPEELAAIEGLADRLAEADLDNEKAVLVLKDKPRAADIAMFGRMLADNPGFNVDAAVQVAHAFTTHRVSVEEDYYTAVDDIKNADLDADKGAGFIGVQHFGAGTFYLYICIDADLLKANLSDDLSLTKDALAALIRAAATVSPGGKQNSFASRSVASYVLLETGGGTPRSLSAAFQRPVGSVEGEDDYLAASVERLRALRSGLQDAYAENFSTTELYVGAEGSATLAQVIEAASAVYGHA